MSEPLGSPAEEARRLAEVLSSWAGERLAGVNEHLATGAAECQVCPVCQVIAALRGDRPDLTARIGDAVGAFLSVLNRPAEAQRRDGAARPGSTEADTTAECADGAAAFGAATEGATTDNAATDGTATDGAATDDTVMDDTVTDDTVIGNTAAEDGTDPTPARPVQRIDIA